MNTKAEAATSIIDVIKQVFSLVIIASSIAAFYYFSDYALLYRVLGIVAIILLAMLMLLTTTAGKSFWEFLLESKQEVRKVVWPSRQETTQTTLMVFAMVFIVGLILWLLDSFLFWGVRLLTGQGG